ncbi:HEAT repeat domain-containing protein [Dickeya zeae]|uniref:HEAT repeat domain-containing protein n=1 Tax=Dickeya zeae TaxID=204042 RepID=UPI001CFAF770|nr:HEAT repeat domain-containing protein [Dickeya zeae]UCZ77146.1 HEAT repeat domain-containing protein [Dickeya zeae]
MSQEKIKELVKKANCKTSWKQRLDALNEIKTYDCQERNDVVIRLALHDKVFKIKEEAFRVAQFLGLTKNGKPISLGKKDIGYKPSDFTKKFKRIKHELGMDDFKLETFKNKFLLIDPEMFDVMQYEKGINFDMWIQNTYQGLPKK